MAEEKKDVVPSQYRDKYKGTGGGCGDFIATALTKVAKDGAGALTQIKVENGIEADRWSGFNAGMQRMNLANMLRARFLKGETVKILGKEYNAKHMVEDFNGTVKDDPKTLGKLASYFGLQEDDRTVKALGKLFFPLEKKGPTAEERTAAKAAKDAEKAAAKQKRDEAAAAKKAAANEKKTAKATAATKDKSK